MPEARLRRTRVAYAECRHRFADHVDGVPLQFAYRGGTLPAQIARLCAYCGMAPESGTPEHLEQPWNTIEVDLK